MKPEEHLKLKRRDDLKRIIDLVVLDTGCSRALVGKIVGSFLGNYQEKVSEGPVYINGFGEMISEIKTRKYFDINRRVKDEASNPKIKFIPSKEFLRYMTIPNE
jgi:hypothetical protein